MILRVCLNMDYFEETRTRRTSVNSFIGFEFNGCGHVNQAVGIKLIDFISRDEYRNSHCLFTVSISKVQSFLLHYPGICQAMSRETRQLITHLTNSQEVTK